MTYVVSVYDRAGLYISLLCVSFDHAVSEAARCRERYGNTKVVKVMRSDLIDQDHDGLTDAERAFLLEEGF